MSVPEELTELERRLSGFCSIGQAMARAPAAAAVRGWVHRSRSSNKVAFLVVRDASDIIQCVVKQESHPELFELAKDLPIESSVMLSGPVREEKRAPSGYEMSVEQLVVVHRADVFPIAKDQSPEFLLDQRHLWLRSRKLVAVLRVRHTVLGAMHRFFRERDFHEFSPPIFTPNACEGGATLFKVKYFDDTVYLTQSWQLYAEAAIFALERIYCVSPTFRAEQSKTSRHLAEFWMHEMESAWLDLHGCADIAKEELRFIVREVLEKNRKDLDVLGRDVARLRPAAEKDIPTITYTEALRLLREAGMDVEWGKDLRTVEEEKLMERFDTPVVVTEYPKEAMAFYKPVKKDGAAPGPVALCFDILAPEGYGEIVGGSQRDLDIEALKQHLQQEGEKPETYEWYFDTRRYGSVPHAGYGMGVERVIAWLCGLDNIKDAIPFPRTMLRSRP